MCEYVWASVIPKKWTAIWRFLRKVRIYFFLNRIFDSPIYRVHFMWVHLRSKSCTRFRWSSLSTAAGVWHSNANAIWNAGFFSFFNGWRTKMCSPCTFIAGASGGPFPAAAVVYAKPVDPTAKICPSLLGSALCRTEAVTTRYAYHDSIVQKKT